MSAHPPEFSSPPHGHYDAVWELGSSGAQGVKDYLAWLLDSPERAESAASNFFFLGIGMHFLTVAQKKNAAGEVIDKIELNFWDENYPPQVGAGGHAHARAPELWSFIHPRARQRVSGIQLLPPGTQRLPDLPVAERQLAMLTKVDVGDGRGTIYHPAVLGRRLTIETVTDLPPGAYQRFSSLFIHEVTFSGPGTGVTVQRQGPSEQAALNTPQGFMTYKGLTEAEAEQVISHRRETAALLGPAANKLVASTVLVRDLDFTPDQMEDRAQPASDRFEQLAVGAIHSAEALVRSQAA